MRQSFWIGLAVAIFLLAFVRVPPNVIAESSTHTLELKHLPLYLALSWGRMLVAYGASLVFAVFVGVLAATSAQRQRLLMPLIDVLQSVPILGFFPTAIYWFVKAGGSTAGVEMAVIFLIFTCQSWNLVFAVFDAVKSIPNETLEAARGFGLGSLAVFRLVFLPAAFPRLVDNSILSWSNGWFFLMASEIIALGSMSYRVPGVGSFLQDTLDRGRWDLVIAAIGALLLLILLMDVLVWKPLRSLAARFKFESTSRSSDLDTSTGARILAHYRMGPSFAPLRKLLSAIYGVWVRIEDKLQPRSRTGILETREWKWGSSSILALFWGAVFGLIVVSVAALTRALTPPWTVSPHELFLALGASTLRILAAYLLSVAWILPLVYWAHRRGRILRRLQSAAQIAASMPATAFFPLVILVLTRLFGTPEVASIVLLMTGMQWYLLFNVIGGAMNTPSDIREASDALGVRGSLYARKIFLPGLFATFVTGSITAVGGGWNALIIAEYSKAASAPLKVFGIGRIMNEATFEHGDEKLLALCLLLLVSWIVLLNRVMWQPLYKWAEKKFRWDA